MNRSSTLAEAKTEAVRRPAPWGTSMVRLGSLPANSEQGLRLIQDRLALYGKATFSITAMFLVATAALDYWLRDDQSFISPAGRASHLVATLAAFTLWRVARSKKQFSPVTLRAIDAAGTIGMSLAFAAMGYHFEQPSGFYTALLAVIHINVGRAAVVPSEAMRTLVIAAASFLGLVIARALLSLPPGLAYPDALRARWLVEALLWSTAGSGVATLSSRVIYGLHEKARQAQKLGQYELEEKIGQGGMGEIYRARHAMLRRPTALKLLAGNGSEEQLRRFEKEVQLTARLTHPNTISIYDYGRTPDGTFYYAMELLEGLTIQQLVARHGPQPAGRVIHLLQQVCGALAEAHGIGLIHRDIKPANVYLCRRGGVPDVVKVLDFGLVREVKGGASMTASNLDVIVGTPLYLSPEAILFPDRIDARADLYGVGGVAYFLLTGSPPFSGKGIVEICSHHLHTPPEPPSRLHPVREDLDQIVLACLAKEASARPATATLLSQSLGACKDASDWTQDDAERWWTEVESMPPPAPAADMSEEQSRKTFCPVDLGQRLTERKQTA